jgi:periplasmic copper chaperone A
MIRLRHAALALVLSAAPALAEPVISVEDGYVRASAMSGAAFMVIANAGDTDDRLIAAQSDAAERAELHTHIMDAAGVMRMLEVKDGIAVPAGGSHELARGGDHVMLMGLTAPLADGDTVALTLVFEEAGEIEVVLPVDNARMPAHGHGHGG